MRQNKFKRVCIFTQRFLGAKYSALTKLNKRKRIQPPRILLNSIPKAGTNLLDGHLGNLPGISLMGHRIIIAWNDYFDLELNSLLIESMGYSTSTFGYDLNG